AGSPFRPSCLPGPGPPPGRRRHRRCSQLGAAYRVVCGQRLHRPVVASASPGPHPAADCPGPRAV
ncbi:hypothetical protein QQX98_013331, partial [Neonectria punicea]